MNHLRLLPLLLLALVSSLAWAESDEAEAVAAEKKACEAAIKEDDARDEQKLTDAYRAKCKALTVASVPLKPLETTVAGSTTKQTQADETTPPAASGAGGGATGDLATPPPAAPTGGETRLGAFAPDESYPDEGARGRGGAENAMAFRQGYLDEGKRDLKDTRIDNEHYLAGASAQRNDARTAQEQQAAAYPDETQKSMGATGSGAAYREGYLANKAGSLDETRAAADANYRAGSEGHKEDLQTAIARNTNPVITDSGEVVKKDDGAEAPKVEPAALTTKSTLPDARERTPEEKQADARETASRKPSDLLRDGLFSRNRQDAAVLALSYCRERGYNEQTCASAMRVIQKESKFDPYAKNPTSSAYGLGQYINSTWRGECTQFLGLSASECAARRSDPKTQLDTLFESTQRRYDRFTQGRLDCRGLSFDACNYIVYHHSGSWSNPNYIAIGSRYYNSTVASGDAAYRAAFSTLANTNPDVAMAQLSLTRGTTVTQGFNGGGMITNRSLGYYGSQGNGSFGYSGLGNFGGYQDYNYNYTNPVNYSAYQPAPSPAPTMPMMMGGGAEAPTGPSGLPVIKVATDPHKDSELERGFEQLRQQQSQATNPNLIQNPAANGTPAPANLNDDTRGYDALRKGTNI